MSYEGYYQLLCANGHEFSADALDFGHDGKCPHCKADSVWWNGVDQTNDDGDKDIVELTEIEPAKMCQCNECDNMHMVAPARYALPPEGKGHRGKFSNDFFESTLLPTMRPTERNTPMIKLVMVIAASLFFCSLVYLYLPSSSHHLFSLAGISFSYLTVAFLVFMVVGMKVVYGGK